MKTYKNLYEKIVSYENLLLAWRKARKGKTQKIYVIEFEKNLEQNLLDLRTSLLLMSYTPKPLKTFIITDPKTRKISKSDFVDRIVHHAICNIIEPIFERLFIYDSYANRIGKGTLAAIKRLYSFMKKVTKNGKLIKNAKNKGDVIGWYLKADIYHYFDEVNQEILLNIIKRKIKDRKLIILIQRILINHISSIDQNFSKDMSYENVKELYYKAMKGMPLGNLTSQFFANIYLNELDQFIKHQLKVKYYIRYVDDFIILENDPHKLKEYKEKIAEFLEKNLELKLHPHKCRIRPIKNGIDFLGFRNFYHHKLLRKKSIIKIIKKMKNFKLQLDNNEINYDKIYDTFEGWINYANNADTYKLRKSIFNIYDNLFKGNISTKDINRMLKTTEKYVPT